MGDSCLCLCSRACFLTFDIRLIGVECSVSMDSVLQGRYQGNWSAAWCHGTRLCLPRHLSSATQAPPQPMGSSTTSRSQPGSHAIVTPVSMSRPPVQPTADNMVESKVGIATSARRVAKNKEGCACDVWGGTRGEFRAHWSSCDAAPWPYAFVVFCVATFEGCVGDT